MIGCSLLGFRVQSAGCRVLVQHLSMCLSIGYSLLHLRTMGLCSIIVAIAIAVVSGDRSTTSYAIYGLKPPAP